MTVRRGQRIAERFARRILRARRRSSLSRSRGAGLLSPSSLSSTRDGALRWLFCGVRSCAWTASAASHHGSHRGRSRRCCSVRERSRSILTRQLARRAAPANALYCVPFVPWEPPPLPLSRVRIARTSRRDGLLRHAAFNSVASGSCRRRRRRRRRARACGCTRAHGGAPARRSRRRRRRPSHCVCPA